MNDTTQTLGLGKRPDFTKITSDWLVGSHKGGVSHLHNLVSPISLKVKYWAPKSKCIKVREREREIKKYFIYSRVKIFEKFKNKLDIY